MKRTAPLGTDGARALDAGGRPYPVYRSSEQCMDCIVSARWFPLNCSICESQVTFAWQGDPLLSRHSAERAPGEISARLLRVRETRKMLNFGEDESGSNGASLTAPETSHTAPNGRPGSHQTRWRGQGPPGITPQMQYARLLALPSEVRTGRPPLPAATRGPERGICARKSWCPVGNRRGH